LVQCLAVHQARADFGEKTLRLEWKFFEKKISDGSAENSVSEIFQSFVGLFEAVLVFLRDRAVQGSQAIQFDIRRSEASNILNSPDQFLVSCCLAFRDFKDSPNQV